MNKAKARIDEGINGYSSNNENAHPADLSILYELCIFSDVYDLALTMPCSFRSKFLLLIGSSPI